MLPPVIVGALFFGGWEAFVDWQHVREFILPKPSEIWKQLFDNFGLVRSASVVTGTNALVGLILGTILGALLAATANRYRVFGELLNPLTITIAAIPAVVIVSVLEVSKLVILFALMVLAAPLGMMAMCVAVGIAFLFQAVAGLFVVTREGLPFWGTLLRIARPLFSTVPMAAAVLGLRWALAAAGLTHPVVSLVLEIVVVGVVYVGSAFVLAGETARELLEMVREVRARRRGEGEVE